MTKTITDAINELRGDLNNSRNFLSVDKFLYWCSKGHYYICAAGRGTFTSRAKYVCTVDEFEPEVRRMSLNFGKCSVISRANYQLAYKQLLQPVKAELIFTQEMYDNGEFPSVGMECLAVYGSIGGHMANTWVVIAHINDKVQFACIDENGDYLIQYISEDSAEEFKPLPPQKTDREILFDQINAIPRIHIADANKLVDKIINGDLHGVTWGKL